MTQLAYKPQQAPLAHVGINVAELIDAHQRRLQAQADAAAELIALSDHLKQALKYFAQGFEHHEVSRLMGVPKKTAANYKSLIERQTGMSLIEAAVMAERAGLLGATD